jgi:hypothetical protein
MTRHHRRRYLFLTAVAFLGIVIGVVVTYLGDLFYPR